MVPETERKIYSGIVMQAYPQGANKYGGTFGIFSFAAADFRAKERLSF